MPSKVLHSLNQLIRTQANVAEINGASRPFVTFSLERLSGQRAKLWGVVWSIFVTAADRPSANAQLALQRGLIVTSNTIFPNEENVDQMIFLHLQDQNTSLEGSWFPARPLPLEPGDSYALTLTIVPRGVFANNAFLQLTVFGEIEPVTSEDLPVVL